MVNKLFMKSILLLGCVLVCFVFLEWYYSTSRMASTTPTDGQPQADRIIRNIENTFKKSELTDKSELIEQLAKANERIKYLENAPKTMEITDNNALIEQLANANKRIKMLENRSSNFEMTDTIALTEQLANANEKIKSWENRSNNLELTDNIILMEQLEKAKEKIINLENILKRHNLLSEIENTIPPTRILSRELDLSGIRHAMLEQLTVVLFSYNESSLCLERRLDTVVENYPGIKIIVLSSVSSGNPSKHQVVYILNIQKEGTALNILEARVKTKYFLYLSPGVSISPYTTNQSISWLYHALESLPELDFVGGSLLQHESGVKYPVYETPCHRLRLCNWTFSQTMEYRYSIGDMMVCEETSPAFMGRTASIPKVGKFDPNLDVMATTDFFLRAKGKAVIGLRPEVFFLVSGTCAISTDDELKVPFMGKYHVYRLKDSLGIEIKAENLKNFALIKDDIKHHEKNVYAKPYFLEGLKFNLETGADYLESQNITYFIDGGVALGAVKVRGILPWDSGDIDLYYVAKWQEVKRGLEEYCTSRGIKAKVGTVPMEGSIKQELLLWAGEFGVNTMFEEGDEKSNQDLYMYIYIHGRRYPVLRNLFQYLRKYYGINYLEMHGHHTGRMTCAIPGHHACVPDEFSKGAGHWRDFYCQT